MLAQLSQWILIAALGQAPSDAALLKAAPAEVDVAVRVKGLEATREDLMAMLKAMNPDWASMAEGALGGPLDQIRTHHGDRAVKSPFLGLIRLGEEGGEGGPPPFAILLPSDDYRRTIKEFMGGGDVELKRQADGDYDAFDGPGGHGTWYSAGLTGIVAFGPSKGLIAEIARKPGRSLDTAVTGPLAKGFLGGDIGVYVNAASLTKRYADQIEQGRQAFMALLDQAGQQAGNARTMKAAREIYGALFDSLKYAEALTLHLDPAAKGLQVSGFLKLKSDSDAAKAIVEARSGELGELGHLPPGAMAYVYMNLGAKTFDRLNGMSLQMIGDDKPSPELEKATAALHAVGRIETIGSARMDQGMVTINAIRVADPEGFIEKRLAILRAMGKGEGRAGLFKEVKVEPSARTHRGIPFTHTSSIIDMDKLAEIGGNNPVQVESMKAMFGSGRMESWIGTDGRRVLEVMAPTWDEARALADAVLDREGGVGRTPGFKAVVADLPDRASFLMLFNLQGLARMMARQFAAIAKNPDLKAPEDMPKEPAYLGASLTPHASSGYEFHLVVPSAVGPVISKGMIPLFQAIAGVVPGQQ